MGRLPRPPGKPIALPAEAVAEEEAVVDSAPPLEQEANYLFYSNALRARRKALGLTQVQLSVKAGVALGTVHLVEKSQQNPSIRSLVTLAEAVGLKLGDLFPRTLSEKEGQLRLDIATAIDEELEAVRAQLLTTQEQIGRLTVLARLLRNGRPKNGH